VISEARHHVGAVPVTAVSESGTKGYGRMQNCGYRGLYK